MPRHLPLLETLRPSASTCLPLLAGFLLIGAGLTGVRAADGQPTDGAVAPAATSAAYTPYTTRAGDTLERIAQQQYRDSPLQQALLVKMLQEHNALLLPQVRPRQRLKAGLVLQLPTHEQLARKVLAPYLQVEEPPRAAHSTPEQRKTWVRYP
jgi:Tfp pilus assembly protein FimV